MICDVCKDSIEKEDKATTVNITFNFDGNCFKKTLNVCDSCYDTVKEFQEQLFDDIEMFV